jgi:nicotinate-nucleotide pyrophosphorylase (carboxylating)
MSPATLARLRGAGLDPDDVAALVRAALREDLGVAGDITSAATVPVDAALDAFYVARVDGTVAGLPVIAAMVEEELGAPGHFDELVEDGAQVRAGQRLARVQGPARGVLALERTTLNLLGHLSGVATATRAWVEAVAGTGVLVRDTRKTMPLLRALEKYAVRCGGGVNHRAGLHDAVLIKDNHLVAAGGVRAALDAVRSRGLEGTTVQVEVDDLGQLVEALDHGAGDILLDNFDLGSLRRAVALTRARAPETRLEASGGLTLERAHAVASTGIDSLAVGALTHSAPNLDIGLDAQLTVQSPPARPWSSWPSGRSPR